MERALVLKKQRDGRLMAVIGDTPCFTPVVPTTADGFLNGDVTKRKDQKWTREGVYPTEEEIDALTEHEQDLLRAREASRLMDGGGAWIMLDGEPIYLTPDHYFFLVHFKLPDLSYPVFYEVDVKDFMWKVAVSEDEDCIGGVFMGARQRGKTARAAARKLRKAMVTPGGHFGITSKTDTDAKEILNKFISHALREMSDLIRPVTSLSTDDAQTKIAFKAPAQRGKKGLETKRLRALNSKIERRNSKPGAFDGETVAELLSDEWAKKQDYDTEERLTVVSRMMWDRMGKRKGLIWMPSTIDEKEDFETEMPQRVWDGSDPLQRGANGRTKTGLLRLFIPETEGSVVDEYGRSMLKEAREKWAKNAPDKVSDPIAYRRYCRANPRTPEDGFASANRDTNFNLDNLDAARDNNTDFFNRTGRYYWGFYALEWEDPETRTKVKAVPSANGRFKLVMRALPEELNGVVASGVHTSLLGTFTRYKPLNEARNVVGCDPYNARKVVNMGAASRGAAYAFWKPDVLHEAERLDSFGKEKEGYWPSDGFFAEYINRPPSPNIFFEDMVKLCHFLGAPILIENNKDALLAYFEDRGYADFMKGKTSIVASLNDKIDKKRKSAGTPDGMAASTDTTDQWSERISDFTHGPLGEDLRRMPFNDQIKDVVNLNLKETKKYDAAVATGWTMLLARRFKRPPAVAPARESYRLSEHFNLAPL